MKFTYDGRSEGRIYKRKFANRSENLRKKTRLKLFHQSSSIIGSSGLKGRDHKTHRPKGPKKSYG